MIRYNVIVDNQNVRSVVDGGGSGPVSPAGV